MFDTTGSMDSFDEQTSLPSPATSDAARPILRSRHKGGGDTPVGFASFPRQLYHDGDSSFSGTSDSVSSHSRTTSSPLISERVALRPQKVLDPIWHAIRTTAGRNRDSIFESQEHEATTAWLDTLDPTRAGGKGQDRDGDWCVEQRRTDTIC